MLNTHNVPSSILGRIIIFTHFSLHFFFCSIFIGVVIKTLTKYSNKLNYI
ncbi:Hypothetical protein PAS_chr2-2_0399 [Komagataella phaffii GS115]|uniref:Uncharacterized protein n=1 Tax=Komagataella phaffii (strain GS115 / ATCC 20864) TaxID=644223 RepID=C4R1Y6_KOMPG|nr:Hypothetical protein PAS_chr2-2_0399 [Komagataella phaffii GS115]CAY69510.1 Hypothetical protein PAS_chr2-2_0399 [Komagataella phaffii GS115]